jgi:hypothetical protein
MRRPVSIYLPAISIAALCLTVAGALPAGATSGAHFFADTAASVTSSGPATGALSVNIDEAGVGSQTVNYTLDWSATADYGCLNGGGNHPQAANKAATSANGASSLSESPIHGRVMATVSVSSTPPPAPTSLSCGGQTEVLADVSYTATLTDTTNHTSIDLKASATFFTFGK